MQDQLFHPIQLIKRLGILVFAYALCRVLFLLFNASSFPDTDYSVFISGIRFDLVSIGYSNLLFIFLSLLPFRFRDKKSYQFSLKIIFYLSNILPLALNYIDLVYFKFTLKRTTADLFKLKGMQNDIWNLLPQFIKDYWYIPLIFILLIILTEFLYRKTEKINPQLTFKKFQYYIFQSFLMITGMLSTLIMTRGGTQGRPINIVSAGKHTNAANIPLVLNTPFTIMMTLETDNLELKEFLPEEEALAIYNPIRQYKKTEDFKKLNVVVIIMESFSAEYTSLGNSGVSYTPFLDSIASEGFYFSKAYANGKRSVEGIPAILASLPTLMDFPFIASPYSANKISSLASLLKEKEYNTSFFHGGNNGTMSFDDFTALAGFKEYYGRFEYEAEKKNNGADYDGLWGIWDDKFISYFFEKTEQRTQPFFSTFFSVSSHHPFELPADYKNKFEEGSIPIHKCIRYSDQALKSFFEKAKNTSWFENTLFVITADHTGPAGTENQNWIDIHHIPLVFYHPGSDLKGVSDKIVQQIDILPTILDQLNYSEPFFAYGQNAFDENAEGFSINYYNNSFQLFKKDLSLVFDGNEEFSFFDRNSGKNISQEEKKNYPELETIEKKTKAVIQVYTRSLIENKQSVK